MKKSACTIAGLVFTTLFLLLNTSVFSQINTTWKGGTPGMENDWNCPKNWSTYKVPDAFSNVIIHDVSTTSLATPIIKNGKVEVNSLFLDTKASLTVEESAQLVVFQREASYLPPDFRPQGRLFLLDGTAQNSTAASAALK